MNILENLNIDGVINAAYTAGEAIMKIYDSSYFGVERKADDSPLTLADKAAHIEIVKYLESTGWPILSEEGKQTPFEERNSWDTFWMVDPLDGTKEFINKNGEFTVNIALLKNNVPVFGVVYAPVLDKMYYGGTAIGSSFLITGKAKKVRLRQAANLSISKLLEQRASKVIVSRSHQNQATVDFIEQFNAPKLISMGSSLKFMILAEGNADIYPRFAPTMEWDTAAADGILKCLNYGLFKLEGDSLSTKKISYNKSNLLNPFFIVY